MRPRLLLFIELALLLAAVLLANLGYLPLPILPLILVAWVSLHLRHLRWRDVGLRRPEHWLAILGLALLIGIAYQALDSFVIAPFLQRLTGEAIDLSQFNLIRGNLALLILSLVITWTEAAFLEEMFFRGYLLNRLEGLFPREGSRVATVVAVLGSAVIFGTAHAYQGVTGIIDTALAGVVLGLLYLASRRNLWLPILAHGVIDTLGFALIFAGWVS